MELVLLLLLALVMGLLGGRLLYVQKRKKELAVFLFLLVYSVYTEAASEHNFPYISFIALSESLFEPVGKWLESCLNRLS